MNTGGDRAISMIFDMLIQFSNAAVGMALKDMVTHAPHISQGESWRACNAGGFAYREVSAGSIPAPVTIA